LKNLAKLEESLNAIEREIRQAKAECGSTEDRLPQSNVYLLGLLAATEGSIKTAKDFLASVVAQQKANKKKNQSPDLQEE
jgi:hypothetical protein